MRLLKENIKSERRRAIWEGELCSCASHHASAARLWCESS